MLNATVHELNSKSFVEANEMFAYKLYLPSQSTSITIQLERAEQPENQATNPLFAASSTLTKITLSIGMATQDTGPTHLHCSHLFDFFLFRFPYVLGPLKN